ncbi:MAG: hypothetical protein PHC51_07120 [bacterium]|nr:hypothetical protein [bacterium]
MNEALQARIIPNMCQPNTTLAKDAMDVLNDFGIDFLIPVTDSHIHLRTAYRSSAVFGATVHDQGSSASTAIQEIDALVDEVLSILSKAAQGTIVAKDMKSAPRPKMIRDSFTMPETDYGLFDKIKVDCMKAGITANKSEIIRAGPKALSTMNQTQLREAIGAIDKVKPGRVK